MRSLLFMALALALAGCSGQAMSDPIVVRPAEYDAKAMAEIPLADGAPIDLVRPPQGGFVVFVGAQVKNLDEQTVELDGQLRDAAGALVSEDKRTVTMVVDPGDPTISEPDLRSYTGVANIAVCPSTASTDRYNIPMTLSLTVTEPGSGRRGLATIKVTPSCRQTDATELMQCQCECAAGYTLGKCGVGAP